MGFLITSLIGTLITYNTLNWKDNISWFEQGFFSFIIVLFIMIIIYLIMVMCNTIKNWIVDELIPKFKETQQEFDYVPEDKSKVKFD